MFDVAVLGAKIDPTGAQTGARDVNRAVDSMGKEAKETSDVMGSAFGKVAGVLSALAATIATVSFIDTLTQTEQLRGQLETATGSMAGMTAQWEILEKFAAETPFLLSQSVDGFVKLKNLGLAPSERALTSFGNTAVAMGKNLNQMIEAVADASVNEFERLKEFGIKAKSQGENIMLTFQNVTTTIKKESDAIVGYLTNLGEVNFAGAMERQMERLPGLLSNVQGGLNAIIVTIGDLGVTSALSDFLRDIISLFGSFNRILKDNAETVGLSITILISLGKAFATLLILPRLVIGVKALGTAFVFLGTSIKGPIAVLTSLAFIVEGVISHLQGATDNLRDMTRATDDLSRSVGALDLATTASKMTELSVAMEGTRSEINDINSDTLLMAQSLSGSVTQETLDSWTTLQARGAKLSDTQQKMMSSLEPFRNQLVQVTLELDAQSQQMAILEKHEQELIANGGELSKVTFETATATGKLTKEQKALVSEQEKSVENYDKLIRGLEFELKALSMTDREIEWRNTLLKLGTGIMLDEVSALKVKFDALNDEKEAQEQLSDTMELRFETMRKSQEKFNAESERLNRIFADSFSDMLLSSEQGFDGFLDRMLESFKEWLARIGAEAIAGRIIVPIAMQAAGALGGLPELGGLSSFLGLPGLLGAGSAGGSIVDVASGSGTFGGVGGLGLLGAAGLGAGFGGLVNAAFGGNTTTGALGGGLGAGLGFALTAGNPIGAAIVGFIGSLVGLFGGAEEDVDQLTLASRSPETGRVTSAGAFGDVYLGVPFGPDPDELADMAVRITALDNVLAGFLSEDEIGRAAAAAEAFSSATDVDTANPAGLVRQRLRDVLNAVDDGLGALLITITQGLDHEVASAYATGILAIHEVFREGETIFSDVGSVVETVNVLVEDFANEGETLIETLTRVKASIEIIGVLGLDVDEASTSFAHFSVAVIDSLGGINAAADAISFFRSTFYTEAELIADEVTRLEGIATTAFDAIGVAFETTSIEDFRMLFDAVKDSLSPDQLALWIEAGVALGLFTDATQALIDVTEQPIETPPEPPPGVQDTQPTLDAALDLIEQRENIIAPFARDLENLDPYEEEIANINDTMEETIENLVELGAFESELTTIRLWGAEQIARVERQRIADTINAELDALNDFIAAIQQVENVVENIESRMQGLASAIQDDIETVGLSDTERANWLLDRANELGNTIQNIDDIEELDRVTAQIEQLTRSAWSLLTDTERQNLGADFIAFVEEVERDAINQASIIRSALDFDPDGALASALEQAGSDMTQASSEMLSAVGSQTASASTMRNAVNEFRNIVNNFPTVGAANKGLVNA